MGAKESKPCISYEEAVKEVKEHELKRLREAYKQYSNPSGLLSKQCFIRDVFGDYIPSSIAETIYTAFGGTSKGITFKDLFCGLVLINKKSSLKLKYEFLFNIYAHENGNYISKLDFQHFLSGVESMGTDLESVATLFDKSDKVSLEEFCHWIKNHKEATSLSRWLLTDCNSVSIENEFDIPTFHQTLSGVTHLEESDIIDLEKIYWNLKEKSLSGKLDLETLRPLISPPLPLSVCVNFFNVFDENRDGHVDFKEMACGISAACRGPLTERQKFCFKIFDEDHDGFLSSEEINNMVNVLLFVHQENSHNRQVVDKEVVLEDIRCYRRGHHLTVEEYVMWTVHNNLSADFLNLIFQICHIVLGLKPITRKEEGDIVRGWLQRAERKGYHVGELWCFISMDWWHSWESYVSTNTKPAMNMNSLTRDGKICRESVRAQSAPFIHTNGTGFCSSPNSSFRSNQIISAPSRPGPVDNNTLLQPNTYKVPPLTGEGGKLKSNLLQIQDYELVPLSLWNAFIRWYGASLCVPRQVILPPDKNAVELEMYPPVLRVLKHHFQPQAQMSRAYSQYSWPNYSYGSSTMTSSAYSYLTNLNGKPKKYMAYTASFSRLATVRQVYDYLCGKLKIRTEDMRLWHYHDENNMVLLEDEDCSLETLGFCDDDQILLEIRNKDLTWPEEICSLACSEKNKQIFMNVAVEQGVTGLNNLGNTCFMNAAVQCVSNTRVLTQYFINDMHLYELNRTNTLGMKGHIAKRYGDLIRDIWSGSAKTIAPLKLRWTIGKYAPRFSGFQQHDSQEFLAFLLDGLHEDLNRVQDKPYLELKDSENRPDVAVAQEAWENHILRNKSIVVDLFHGQLKSKVTCQICHNESVRFDPFNYLSLPLPMESYICLQIAVIKLNGSVPVKYNLRLDGDDSCIIVKQHLSHYSTVPTYLLMLTEVSASNIRAIIPGEQKAKSLANSVNFLCAYELPASCNGSGSVSGDDERLSIASVKSNHREAAQTFTNIQRTVKPVAKNGLNGHQKRTISEESSDSANGTTNGGSSDVCCVEVRWLKGRRSLCMLSSFPCCFQSNECGADCSEVLLEDTAGRLTDDSGHCSASSASLADSVDTGGNNVHLNPCYVIALHRNMMRRDVYMVSSEKSRPKLFGLPVVVPCNDSVTHTELYQAIWLQVARFVSPLPPSEACLNHATDCDDSLGYEFPFLLKAVNKEGLQCAWCPWYKFCRGHLLPCCDVEFTFSCSYIAIDWDPTALHLRYQSSEENHYEIVGENVSRKHLEPISIKSCLEAFTTEEHLSDEEKYFCSKCGEHQPASKKLQIWRLPPILIIHLKRFQLLNGKWVKSQKVVNFPFKHLDITEFLASVPRETVNRFGEISNIKKENATGCNEAGGDDEKLSTKRRKRLESTSLSRTPINDENLQDFHQHKLENPDDAFNLKYNLYGIVSHSGILGGGHYVSYACNPNGKWYCYNDSSCREVVSDMDTSSAYMLFYEREGLSYRDYMPNVLGKTPVDVADLDQDFENDYKKACHIM